MADKAELDLELRLKAIEYVVALLGRAIYLDAGITPDQLKQAREAGREKLLHEAFPGLDPVLADHVSAEFADRVDELLSEIENQVRDAHLKVSRGEI